MNSEEFRYWGDVIKRGLGAEIMSFNKPFSILYSGREQIWFQQLASNSELKYEDDLNVLTRHILREFLEQTEKKLQTPDQWLHHGICFVSLVYIFHAHLLEDMKISAMMIADPKDYERLNSSLNHSETNRMLSVLTMMFDKLPANQCFDEFSQIIWQVHRSHDERKIPDDILKHQYQNLQNLPSDHPKHILIKGFIDITYQTHYLKLFSNKMNEERSLIHGIWDKFVFDTTGLNSKQSVNSNLAWLKMTGSNLCQRHQGFSNKSPWTEELCLFIQKLDVIFPPPPVAI